MAGGTKRPVRGRKRRSSVSGRRPARPLRVLMVLDQFNIGGTETHVYALSKQLLTQGVYVVAAGKPGRILGRFAALGIPCYEIDFVLDNHEYDSKNSERHQRLLEWIIEQERIDLVHGHQYPSGYPASQAAARKNVPFVFTQHSVYCDEGFLRRIAEAGTFISVSPPLQAFLRSRGITSTLIANGITAEEYRAYRDPASPYRTYIRRQLQLPEQAKVILYASRLSWEKAAVCEEIIHAMSALRMCGLEDWHLVIIGAGKDDRRIKRLAAAHNDLFGAAYIHYYGEVTNIHTYYAASDLIIGTGRVALEGMACCRPVIAAGSMGYAGIVRTDRWSEAWQTWFGDHDAQRRLTRKGLMRDMREVILMSRDDLDALTAANLRMVQRSHAIDGIARETVQLYEGLTRKQLQPRSPRRVRKMNNRF